MSKPYQVLCYGSAVLSSHTTLANAKRAIGVRWARLKKHYAHTVYTVSFEVKHLGRQVYARGGYV